MLSDSNLEAEVHRIFTYRGSPEYERYLKSMEDGFEYDPFTDGLIGLGSEAVPYILDYYLKNSEYWRSLPYVLGAIGDPRAAQPLLAQLQKYPHPERETHIIIALGEIGNPIAIDVLRDIVQKYKDTWALAAIAQIDDPRAKTVLTELAKASILPLAFRNEVLTYLAKFPSRKIRQLSRRGKP